MGTTTLEPPVSERVMRERDARGRDAREESRSTRSACTTCPVCGSEECFVLQELGMYCDTKTASSLRKLERSDAAEELWATYGVG